MRHYNTYFKRFTVPKVSKAGIKIPTNLKETWVQYVAEVFRNMSLGGFIHFTYIGRHPVEFILWFLVLCMAIVCTILLCLHNWEHYMDNPTVISIESNYREWNISFPSFFICFEKKIDEDVLKEVSIQVASDFNIDAHIVSSFLTALANLSYFNLDTMRNFSKEINIPPENYLQLVKEVSFKYDIQKQIVGEPIKMYTEFGFCYANNSQIAKMIQRNITEQADVTDFIRNDPPTAGSYLSLGNDRSLLDVKTNFEAFIVSPWEVPTVGGLRFSRKSVKNHTVNMELKMSELIATQAVRDLNINRRKCRFYDESNLKISRLYSLSLCHTQCRIDLAVEKCGCAPFFYEGILEAGYKICNVTKMLCLANITEELISILGTNNMRTCNCYPTCESSVYMFFGDPAIVANPGGPTGVKYNIEDFPKYRSKRDVLFTFSDMLVGFGGIAGLFLGFSVLSMVEIICYITLRPFFYMREMNQLRKENNNRRRIMSFS